MKSVLAIVVSALVAVSFAVPTATAFDKCYPAVTGKGKKQHSMRSAMESAKYAWHEAAEKKSDFDDWNYSGDRSISCKWDAAGTHFTCAATAKPCGLHH